MSYLDVAHKKLRKEHNLHINVSHKPWNQKFGYNVTGGYNPNTSGVVIPYNFKNFDTYEDALCDGLVEVHKHINDDKSGTV